MDQYRRLVGGEEDDRKYLYLKALAVLRSNRPAEAVERLEAIRFKVPKPLEPHVLFALGQAYEAVRDPEKAMDAYRQSAQTSRKWAPPWKALARLQAQAHPEEARATLQRRAGAEPRRRRTADRAGQVALRRADEAPAAAADDGRGRAGPGAGRQGGPRLARRRPVPGRALRQHRPPRGRPAPCSRRPAT